MKKVLFTKRQEHSHWVGDGFPVRTIFHYNEISTEASPFLLMDYAGPAQFAPADPSGPRRGVGSHPHRGFETVTLVYQGEVEHRDSAGGGGVISAGDAQWMTAASGLVHEERHGRNFTQSGGAFEMAQLWVNLPRKDKMTKPRYQGLKSASIPGVSLPHSAGLLRVIAGQFHGHQGPALTFSPINLWDIRLTAQAHVVLKAPAEQNAMIFSLDGFIQIGDSKELEEAELAILERAGDTIEIKASRESRLLFLGGEPLNEPLTGYGPFVMNSRKEILQAIEDYESGKMGVLSSIVGSE